MPDHLGQTDAGAILVPPPGFSFACGARVDHLVIAQLNVHAGSKQSLAVHAPEALCGLVLGEALSHHGVAQLVRDSDARRARSEDDTTEIFSSS